MTAHKKPRDLPPTRRMRCLDCHKERVCDYGVCRECTGRPARDGESAYQLDPNGWVRVGNVYKHRDALGRAS